MWKKRTYAIFTQLPFCPSILLSLPTPTPHPTFLTLYPLPCPPSEAHMYTIVKVLTHIEILLNFTDTKQSFRIKKNGKVYVFIFRIGNNYVIGWCIFSAVYNKKYLFNVK